MSEIYRCSSLTGGSVLCVYIYCVVCVVCVCVCVMCVL
jgi:hypothetical protein